jgi:hypothetical protein
MRLWYVTKQQQHRNTVHLGHPSINDATQIWLFLTPLSPQGIIAVVTKSLTPPPPKATTSFMDDPKSNLVGVHFSNLNFQPFLCFLEVRCPL